MWQQYLEAFDSNFDSKTRSFAPCSSRKISSHQREIMTSSVNGMKARPKRSRPASRKRAEPIADAIDEERLSLDTWDERLEPLG
jgi:hypothetical protein